MSWNWAGTIHTFGYFATNNDNFLNVSATPKIADNLEDAMDCGGLYTTAQ